MTRLALLSLKDHVPIILDLEDSMVGYVSFYAFDERPAKIFDLRSSHGSEVIRGSPVNVIYDCLFQALFFSPLQFVENVSWSF